MLFEFTTLGTSIGGLFEIPLLMIEFMLDFTRLLLMLIFGFASPLSI